MLTARPLYPAHGHVRRLLTPAFPARPAQAESAQVHIGSGQASAQNPPVAPVPCRVKATGSTLSHGPHPRSLFPDTSLASSSRNNVPGVLLCSLSSTFHSALSSSRTWRRWPRPLSRCQSLSEDSPTHPIKICSPATHRPPLCPSLSSLSVERKALRC